MQTDVDGNVWLVEDVGGSTGTTNRHARQPNSFVYRFVPDRPRRSDKGGMLQALQVIVLAHAAADRLPRRRGRRGHPLGTT